MREGPAIGLLETTSIARGMVVCDAMVKQAAVDVLAAHTVTPGKFVILVAGAVAEVEEAMGAGLSCAAEQLLDQLLLPHPHAALVPALRGLPCDPVVDALGIYETATIAATLLGADAALKNADLELVVVRLATGIGGKAFFVVSGALHEVQAGLESADGCITPRRPFNQEIIARPHEDFVAAVLGPPGPYCAPSLHP